MEDDDIVLKWKKEGDRWVAHVIEGDPEQGWYEVERVVGRSWVLRAGMYEVEHEYDEWRCSMICLCDSGKMAPAAMVERPTLEQAKAVAQRHWSTGFWG